jgi:hypothetical protein
MARRLWDLDADAKHVGRPNTRPFCAQPDPSRLGGQGFQSEGIDAVINRAAETLLGVKPVESVRLFSHLAKSDDTRSLILHPASTRHRQLTDEQRVTAGARDDAVRLSIGLEVWGFLVAQRLCVPSWRRAPWVSGHPISF